jgi:hypothetical protein
MSKAELRAQGVQALAQADKPITKLPMKIKRQCGHCDRINSSQVRLCRISNARPAVTQRRGPRPVRARLKELPKSPAGMLLIKRPDEIIDFPGNLCLSRSLFVDPGDFLSDQLDYRLRFATDPL